MVHALNRWESLINIWNIIFGWFDWALKEFDNIFIINGCLYVRIIVIRWINLYFNMLHGLMVLRKHAFMIHGLIS